MKYFLISLGVVLLLIFGIVIFNRGGSKPTSVAPSKTIKLTDYAKNPNVTLRMTTAGPINANENHRTIEISISSTSRSVNVFTGYQGQVLTANTFNNNEPAFSEFLAALNRALFTREARVGENINPDAICPTGNRTHYTITDGGKTEMDLWAASCAGGSFGGNRPLTNSLFQAQIPNYSTLTSGVSLGM
jgi:hypothetical protein